MNSKLDGWSYQNLRSRKPQPLTAQLRTREHLAHYVRNIFTKSAGVGLRVGAEILQRLVVRPVDADLN
jgi:hypothetical protein